MIRIAEQAARVGGRILRERYGTALAVRHKGAVDLVTEVDLRSEEAIRRVLSEGAPGTSILGEEEGTTGTGPDRWLVDPLDGTTNYAHGYPFFAVSIAWEENGAVRLGVVYDPLRDELFEAESRRGARLNGDPVRVSGCSSLRQSLLATGFPYDRGEAPRNYGAFAHMTQLTQGVRRGGSAALDLSYVACGRLDGFWEPGLKPWDMAAGSLLVREAAGRVTAFGGKRFELGAAEVVATNGRLHQALLDALEGRA